MVLCLFMVPVVQGLEIAQVGVYDFGVAYDVVYGDNIAYVSGNDGVDVFDVSDRANPEKLTRIDNTDGAFGLHLIEDTLYIAGADDGFFIADVSDPSNPTMMGSITGITALNVFVEGDYAYVTNGGSFSIIDISDPSEPSIISSVPGSDRRYHIHVIEDTLYLACHGNGVKVLDISDKQAPRIIGNHNNGGEAYGIHIVDNYLLVADLQQGVEILDISNPRTPTLAASWTDTHPHGISGDTQYVYLADQDDGLEVFIYGEDVGEPEFTRREDTASGDSLISQIPVSFPVVLAGVLIGVFFVIKTRENPIIFT